MNASNVMVKTWQNGAVYIDWTDSGSWYAGYRDASIIRTGCVKFTLAYPAETVSIPIKSYTWEYTNAENPLYYALSREDGDAAYISRSTAGDSGQRIWWETPYQTRTVTLTGVPAGTHYLYLWGAAENGQSEAWFYANLSVSYEPVPASSISNITKTVDTENAVSISMNRLANCWHRASFRINGALMAETDAFAASISYPVPRSWFSGYPSLTSLTVSVSVQTYTDAACTAATGEPALGSFTLLADSGMKPVLNEGFAAAAPYNTGPAGALSGYIQGYSRAQVTFDSEKVDLSAAAGASIAGYRITAAGQTVDAAPYLSPVLTGRTEILCTVTDSRGRSASATLTVTPESYALPGISQVRVFRCLADGTESEDGSYLSVTATAVYSGLNGRNSASLSARLRPKGGGWGEAQPLTGGTALLFAGLSPDQSYELQFCVTDALNTVTALQTVPTRKWALKFRSGGMGAAFGKAPEEDKALELPEGWRFTIGGRSYLEQVYPVGALYLSVSETSPAALFGFGTWTRIKDCFLLAAGDTYAAGATGGEASHVLSESEMPAHRHYSYVQHSSGSETAAQWKCYLKTGGWGQVTAAEGQGEMMKQHLTEYTGSWNTAHNNMPPYLAVYIWQRTA